MRLYISNKLGSDGSIIMNGEILKSELDNKASLGSSGDIIVILNELPMILPRGKITVHFMKSLFKITGQTYDYKIPYTNFTKAFLLPRQDGDHIAFVIGLKTAMKIGGTNYPFLVFQFKKGSKRTVKINLPEDETQRKELLHAPLSEEITGELFDIMANLLKSIIGINVVIPGKFKR